MSEAETTFEYVAMDGAGRRVKGTLAAASDLVAFERLKRQGLSPMRLKAAPRAGPSGGSSAVRLSEREVADFLADLSALLTAGAGMRGSLAILGGRSGRLATVALCKSLNAEISGGGALDQAFGRHLGRRYAFVGALVAAGEAMGDLPGALARASEMLASRIRLRDQLVSSLSYPAFVFASTCLALAIILLFVVPSLTPLVEDAGATPPLTLRLIIGASAFLRGNLALIGALIAALAAAVAGLAATGSLRSPMDRFVLDGPARKTASGLVFGAFAITLGNMLAGGAPMTDALRLSIRSLRSELARDRLEQVASAVRQGELLSNALRKVSRFPETIMRLAAVGEASGALGPMLARAGKIEEDAAIRRIETVGRFLGPVLIVGLGGLIGLLMAGLLSGVSQLGQSALQ
jgi:type II secretory pathway component PulF